MNDIRKAVVITDLILTFITKLSSPNQSHSGKTARVGRTILQSAARLYRA